MTTNDPNRRYLWVRDDEDPEAPRGPSYKKAEKQ